MGSGPHQLAEARPDVPFGLRIDEFLFAVHFQQVVEQFPVVLRAAGFGNNFQIVEIIIVSALKLRLSILSKRVSISAAAALPSLAYSASGGFSPARQGRAAQQIAKTAFSSCFMSFSPKINLTLNLY